jgi:hypothetical protein
MTRSRNVSANAVWDSLSACSIQGFQCASIFCGYWEVLLLEVVSRRLQSGVRVEVPEILAYARIWPLRASRTLVPVRSPFTSSLATSTGPASAVRSPLRHPFRINNLAKSSTANLRVHFGGFL